MWSVPSQWKEIPVFSSMTTAALMPTQSPAQWLTWALQSEKQSDRSVNLTINLHVMSRVIMNRAMCPVNGMSSCCVAFFAV